MLAWLWHWVIFWQILIAGVFGVIGIISLPRKFGAIFNGALTFWFSFNISAELEKFNLSRFSLIISVGLLLALIDCIIEFSNDSKFKESKDPVKIAKITLCISIAAIMALGFYYIVPVDQRGISNITNNYITILAFSLLPRAISPFLEIKAILFDRIKVKNRLKKGNFLSFSNPYHKRYAMLAVERGNAVSNNIMKAHELDISRNKLKKKFPKLEDEKLQEKMKEMMNEQKYETAIAFISKAGFNNFCIEVEDVLKKAGHSARAHLLLKNFHIKKIGCLWA